MDSTKSIFSSAKSFCSGTFVSRLSGMIRDITMAYVFGVNAHVAALMVAYRLAHLFRRLFGEGAMQSAFIPQYESLRHEEKTRAHTFFGSLRWTLAAGISCLILLIMGTLGIWLVVGSPSQGNREIIQLCLILLPSLLFICLFGVQSAYLQCHGHYFLPGVAPVAFNCVWISGALLLRHQDSATAMHWLAIAILIGCCAQWMITLPLTRDLTGTLGPPRILSADVKKLARPLFLGIVGVAATQINTACDALFARFASPEGPTILWYAIRLQQLPLALFGIAISGALLPPVSRAIKEGDTKRYAHFLRYGILMSLVMMIPITWGIFLFGDWAIRLLYQHGQFTPEAAASTTSALQAYGLALLPTTLILILGPGFYARGDYRTPMIGTCLSVGCNLTLNSIFVFYCGYGPTYIALSTSVSACANVIYLGCMSEKITNFWKVDFNRPGHLINLR